MFHRGFDCPKAVAGRPQDLVDIEGVVYRQGDAQDVKYIQRWLREFSAVLESSELLERFEAPWRNLHGKKGGRKKKG